MQFTKILVSIFFLYVITASQSLSISGIIKDSITMQPIEGAVVSLLLNGLKDTTGTDGTFFLSDTNNASINEKTTALSFSPPRLSANQCISFSINKDESVQIRVFSVLGKVLFSIKKQLSIGHYEMPLQPHASGILIYNIRIGNRSYILKSINPGKSIVNNKAISPTKESFNSENSHLVKSLSIKSTADTLIISKTGYLDKKVSIDSLTLKDVNVLLSNHIQNGLYTGKTNYGENVYFTYYDGMISNFTIRCTTCNDSSTPAVVGIMDSSSHTVDQFKFQLTHAFWRDTISAGNPTLTADTLRGTGEFNNSISATGIFSVSGPMRTFDEKHNDLIMTALCQPEAYGTWNVHYTPDSTILLTKGISGSIIQKGGMQTGLTGSILRTPFRSWYGKTDTVKLTAIPSKNYHFASWNGDLLKTLSDTAWVRMDSTKSISASFEKNFSLTVNTNNGTVTKIPSRILYSPGETVMLIASLSVDSRFTGWSGDTSRTSNDTAWVVMNKNQSVNAGFIQNTSVLRVNSTHCTVSRTPAKSFYTTKDTVLLKAAIPDYCYFIGWSGDTIRTAHDSAWVSMDSSKIVNVSAYQLTLNNSNGFVNLLKGPSSGIAGDTLVFLAVNGTSLSYQGYYFNGWTGDTLRTHNDTAWVVMNSDKVLIAKFFRNILSITALNGDVSKSLDRSYYFPNDTVRLVAIPTLLSRFVKWSGDTLKTSNDTAWVSMDSSKQITALFELVE